MADWKMHSSAKAAFPGFGFNDECFQSGRKKECGWLDKKTHHIGQWKPRFFRLEHTGVLRYWKWPQPAGSVEEPRGELSLAGCHAFPAPGRDRRLVLRTTHARFDEELQAKDSVERDAWVLALNNAARQHRNSASALNTEDFLRKKGLWNSLVDSVASTASTADVPNNLPVANNAEVEEGGEVKVEEVVLSHVRVGTVLLRLPDDVSCDGVDRSSSRREFPNPRQGKLVQAGRRVLKHTGMRSPETSSSSSGATDDQFPSEDVVDSTKVDALAAATSNEAVVLLVSERRIDNQYHCTWPSNNSNPNAPQWCNQQTSPSEQDRIAFDTLHIYANAQDGAGPFASLPLDSIHTNGGIGPSQESADGSGSELRLNDGTRVWTLVFTDGKESESWRRSLETSGWAAFARKAGRRSSPQEALMKYDHWPDGWREAVNKQLRDISHIIALAPVSLSGAGAPTERTESSRVALTDTHRASSAVFFLSLEVLEAALHHTTEFRRDICEDVVRVALGPLLDRLGRFWQGWSGALSQGECLVLLRCLDERLSDLRRLGVVFEQLRTAVIVLATEFALRGGARLKPMARRLVEQTLKADEGLQFTPSAFFKRLSQVKAFPVDLFTMVFSCLPQGPNFDDVLCLRESEQRVAKFVVRETQEVLWAWLLATQEQVIRELRTAPLTSHAPVNISAEAFDGSADAERNVAVLLEALPRRIIQWLLTIGGFAARVPALATQCRELSSLSSIDDHKIDRLGKEALPAEWGLEAEAARFEALQEAFLWALSDAATAQWRRQDLAGSSATVGVGLAGSLQACVRPSLHLLLNSLGSEIFEGLLLKVFKICLSTYIYQVFLPWQTRSGMANADMQLARREKDVRSFCIFFQDAWEAAQSSRIIREPPWQVDKVLNLLSDLLSYHNRQRDASSAAQPRGPSMQKHERQELSKLVKLLQSNPGSVQPLPLREVLENEQLTRLTAPLDELPIAASSSVVRSAQRERCTSDMNVQSVVPEIGKGGANASVGTHQLERRQSMPAIRFQFFGAGSSTPPTRSPRFTRSGSVDLQRAPQRASTTQLQRAKTAPEDVGRFEEQSVVEIKEFESEVEETGTHGLFCGLLVQDSQRVPEGAGCYPSSGEIESGVHWHNITSCDGTDVCGPVSPQLPCDRQSFGALRRRWVQLARHNVQDAARFEIFRTRTSDRSVPALESLSLEKLLRVTICGTVDLCLAFSIGETSSDAARNSRAFPVGALDTAVGQSGHDGAEGLRHYTLHFDCPLEAAQWCRVLEVWWAKEEPSWTRRPIVALCNVDSAGMKCPWHSLSLRLTRETLKSRLGGLWLEVQQKLYAPGR